MKPATVIVGFFVFAEPMASTKKFPSLCTYLRDPISVSHDIISPTCGKGISGSIHPKRWPEDVVSSSKQVGVNENRN